MILTCNQRELTLRCLDSLGETMEAHPDAEVVLVDNGSSDGTLDAVAERRYPWADRLVTVRSETNVGVAPGRNIGLRRAKGDVLMLLDNDTIADRRAVDSLLKEAGRPENGVVAPKLVSPAGEVQASSKPYPGLGVKIAHLLFRNRREEPLPDPYYVIGACQMFRREVFDKVGELDGRIFYGPEDADFCGRVAAAGYKIRYVPEAVIIHDWQRATTRSPFSRLGRMHARALFYFYRKHRRWF